MASYNKTQLAEMYRDSEVENFEQHLGRVEDQIQRLLEEVQRIRRRDNSPIEKAASVQQEISNLVSSTIASPLIPQAHRATNAIRLAKQAAEDEDQDPSTLNWRL